PISLEDYAPLPTGMSMKRWPLARVIARRIPKGFFRLYIADEAHQFKAKGTDRGYAFQLMCNAARRVVLTTATPFGGYPTDLFYLMVRSMPSFRRKYGFHDVAKFISRYGRRAYFYNKNDDGEPVASGKTTGNKRYIVRDKLLPGISPSIYPELLPYAIFLRISDLGYTLPPYEEQMVPIVASELLALQYAWLHDTLYDVIYAGMTGTGSATMHDAMQLLSTWFMNTLRRPMSAFRAEVVMRSVGYEDEDLGIDTRKRMPFLVKRGESAKFGLTVVDDVKRLIEIDGHPSEFEAVNPNTGQPDRAKPTIAVDFDAKSDKAEAMVLYPAVPIDGLLPKEEWLVNAVKELITDDKRKVLLYLEQTGTRDIQPRIERVLAKAGIRSVTVPSGDARGREAWIRERIDGADVLITNPMKVREGLDLVDFSALIFYELPTSLVTLLQAMKRVWRLGQTRDVLVLVPYHVGMENSMEYRVLQLMAQKVRAAALLHGENASSAFADNATDTDSAADLAKAVLRQAAEKLDMTDGIKSLLGDLVEQEMAAARAAQAEAEAAGEEAAGIGVYEAEDDPDADDIFYSEDEEGESAEPEIDVFSLFDLPADIFAPLEEPM
ncbi:MAG TPA: hypothetical protein P5333_26840, partial [Caldilinea sp.]|nr:hypothetical protein [Caldilinea sp.]